MYILVADSCGCGVGILGEIIKYNNMPHTIFLADGQMNPFGLRSVSEVQNIVEDWLKYFANSAYKIKMLVVACNTASLSKVRYQDVQVQGIICTGIERAVAQKETSLEQVKQIVECELQDYKGQFNYVVYACTCFPFVEKEIDSILSGNKQRIVHINSSRYVARDVYEALKQIGLLSKKNYKCKEPLLFTTGGWQWINYVDKIKKFVFDKPIPVRQIQIRK